MAGEQQGQQQAGSSGEPRTASQIKQEDLELLGNDLEDEGKTEAELWAALETEESGGKAAATGTEDQDADDLRRAAAESDEDEGGEAERHGSAEQEGKQPSGEPDGDEDQPSGKGQGEEEGAEGADLFADATPEQRAAHEAALEKLARLEHAERSNRGRISALQRQIAELSVRHGPQQGKPASDKGAGDASAGRQGDGDDQFLSTEEWGNFREEYPEVAGPLEKVIGTLQAEVTRQNKELSAIGEDRRQSALTEQADLLADQHSDWLEVVADDGFEEWVSEQPRHIREAAIRNADNIVDAEEAADVVGRFKAFREQHGGQPAPGKEQTAGGKKSTGSGNQQARRQRQLESASTARSRGPGVASGIPQDGDPETIWKQFDQMESRQAGGGA